jgi:LemA protein
VAQHGCHRRLKADQNFQNFQQLQNELADLANKIAVARRFFNTTAAESHAARKASPAVLFAQSMGFSPQSFFNLDEGRVQAATVPKVKF